MGMVEPRTAVEMRLSKACAASRPGRTLRWSRLFLSVLAVRRFELGTSCALGKGLALLTIFFIFIET